MANLQWPYGSQRRVGSVAWAYVPQVKLVQEAINLKGWMGATHSEQITHAQARTASSYQPNATLF